jgi:trans-2,3-dihydro-3-hydroxyanthranilate isomerase
MPDYPFMQVDAFTDQPLGGNPCAVLFDTEAMNADTMLAVAREMNLSETAFIRASETADFGVRYFTPAEEIPLAGHPTLATAAALVEAGRLALTGEHTTITLELKVGSIPVEIFARSGKIERIVMTQKKPAFLATYDPAEILPVFGLRADDVVPGVPVQTVSTGTPQLMILLRSLDALKRARVDVEAYSKLRGRADFFSPHLFCLNGVTEAGDTFARHFGVPPDTPEDPFTGSATGGMAAYLWRYGLISKPGFIAEQGHWMNRPGKATVEVVGPRDDIQTVRVGGSTVTVLRGQMVI